MNFCNALENMILDRVFRGGTSDNGVPSTIYFGLLLADGLRVDDTVYAEWDTILVTANDGKPHLYYCSIAGTTGTGQGTLYTGVADEVVTDGTAEFTEASAELDNGDFSEPFNADGFVRPGITCSFAGFSGTQGAGTTDESIGSSGTISNNSSLSWGPATADWGLVWGICAWTTEGGPDDGGVPLMWGALPAPVEILSGGSMGLAPGTVEISLSGAYTNYFRNKLLDHFFRGEVYFYSSAVYLALTTTVPTASVPGAEVTGAPYARVEIPCTSTDWLGTGDESGSTSQGSSGTISNANVAAFANPTVPWGDIQGCDLYDNDVAGNRLMFGALTPTSIVTGATVSFPAGSLKIRIDN